MPKTPKKLTHKPPPRPQMPPTVRVIDFEIDEIIEEEEDGSMVSY